MSRPLSPALAALALGLLVALVGGCGVGDSTVQSFLLDGMGPAGGVAEAGDVRLTLPPGALAQETAVGILPESTPFPIVKPAADACTYGYLGPIWCCGPVGLDLLVPATVRIGYDEALLPAGVAETDLVLLLWDDAAQVMRPTTAGVVHDLAGNFFETVAYTQLGHLAVGIRTCQGPLRPIVLLAGLPPALLVRPSALGDGTATTGLFLATSDNSLPLEQLPTDDDEDPALFLPAPDGSRVMYVVWTPQESQLVRTTAPGASGPVTIVDETTNVSGGDPLVGWRRAFTDVFFPEFVSGEQSPGFLGAPAFLGGQAISTVAPDGTGTPAVLYGLGFDVWPVDLRQSDDGTRMLLRVGGFGEGYFERIDVIDAATGALLASDQIPFDPSLPTPRFIPGSTDVSALALDRRSVGRYAEDGTFLETLYELGEEDTDVIVDFAVSPSGDGYAVLLQEVFSLTKPGAALTVGGEDTLEVGTLGGPVGGAVSLGVTGGSYPEMIFHPNGEHVIVDAGGSVLMFSATDATPGTVLPISSMSDLDIHVVDGRLLLVATPEFQEELLGLHAAALDPGLYVADPDGTNVLPISTEGLEPRAARWLTGIRAAPGMFGVPSVR